MGCLPNPRREPNVMPSWLRLVAAIAALLFATVAVQISMGRALTPLSQPLPFFAYPFLAAALFGWAWVHYRITRVRADGPQARFA